MGYSIASAIALAALVATGCAAITFNWFFQNRLARDQSRRTLTTLLVAMIATILAAVATSSVDSPWSLWPFYNLVLACIAVYTWFTFFRSRGLALIDDKIAEAERLREREEQAMRQAFFLRAIAHDLRNPLNSVMLHANFLKAGAGADEIDGCAVAIIDASKKAAEYLSQLLDLARSGTDQTAGLSRTNVAALIEQVVARHVVIAHSKGLSLTIAAPGGTEAVTDSARLERILSNLIDNAIKYTDAGGSVSVSMQTRGDDIVAISIRDTGKGIPAAHLPKLFDEFFQVDNGGRDPSKGWGLGLAICKRLAHQIGADISVASTGPDGTTFQVLLPGTQSRRQRR